MSTPFRPKRDLLRFRQAGQAQETQTTLPQPLRPPLQKLPSTSRLASSSPLVPPPALPTPETEIVRQRRLPSREDRIARARLGGRSRMRKLSARDRSKLAQKAAAAKRRKRKLLRLEASRLDEETAREETGLREVLDKLGPRE